MGNTIIKFSIFAAGIRLAGGLTEYISGKEWSILIAGEIAAVVLIAFFSVLTIRLRRKNKILFKDVEQGWAAIAKRSAEVESLTRQKEALDRAYDDLQNIIDSTPWPIALFLPSERKFRYVNQYFLQLFHIPDDYAVYSGTWDAFTPQPIDELCAIAMAAKQTVMQEWEFKTYDGETFDAQIYLKKVMYKGEECLVASHKDLREEKEREQMLLGIADKERETHNMKSQFIMNLGHEFRTPMNAIIGTAQLAKKTDSPEKLFYFIEQIKKSSSVLLNILNDIMDLSMINDGKLVLKAEETDLRRLAEDVFAVITAAGTPKKLACSLHLDGVRNPVVLADPSRLQQVLVILGSNAVKYTHKGGKVSFSVQEEAGKETGTADFLFTVCDNGIGIDADKIEKIFEPFEQGDNSITRQYGGAGLGLAIAKSIVGAMGGKLWAESTPKLGSTFYCSLPLPLKAVEKSPLPEAPAGKQLPDFSKMCALVVDDVELNRLIAVELLLGEFGMAVEEAENGQQAAELFSASVPGYYDFILMDIQMPVMDGITAAKTIRSLPRPDAAKIPIVALTANVMPSDVERISGSGMNGIIAKPIFLDKMKETIHGLF